MCHAPLSSCDLAEQVVVAQGAVPLDSSHHEVLDIDHTSSIGLQLHHIETFTNQVVTRYERGLLTLSEGANLTTQRPREEEEERRKGEHRRTEREEERWTVKPA